MHTADHTFSVVINTTDRAASLRTLLYALEHQSYSQFEVIAVVGPTHDNTLDVLGSFGGRVRVCRCPVANLSVSRNIGLQAARGDIVAYIDDDAVPARNWLLQINRLFADPQVAATGGAVHLIHPNHATLQYRRGMISALAEQHDVRGSLLDHLPAKGLGRFWTMRMMGANMAFRRTALFAVGGFDEFYEWVYDDSDVAMRLAAAGYLVQPGAEAYVYHVPASSRNRVAFTFQGRWWIQTKALVYFAVRNGRVAGVPASNILRRIGYAVPSHIYRYGGLFARRVLSFGQMLTMQMQEVKAAAHGATSALFKPAALLPGSSAEQSEPRLMQRFQNEASSLQPAVDPISGHRPQIALVERPLRVALLSRNYPPQHYEGVGRHTNLMAKGLFELGHTVHVLTHSAKENISFYDGAYVHHVPYRLDRYLHLRRLPQVHHLLNYSHAVFDRLHRLVLNDDIQVVDSPVWQTDGFVCAVSGDLPVVVRPQTAQRQIGQIEQKVDDDTRLVGEIEESLLRHAASIVANSEATVAALAKVYGISNVDGQVCVIPHGIEPVDEQHIRPFQIGQPKSQLKALYVGRLEKRKGILDLFAAIREVRRRLPHVQFVVAGADNSRSDGFMRKTGLSYPAYFAKWYPECAAHVSFLGPVAEDELQTLYQSCDLFVAPSLYESFGLIYLEAMNYAKPVIGCRAGGIPEVVDDGVTGRLVDPQSPRQLAEAIVTLLQSPQLLYDYGVAGRQRLLSRFTHIHMARGFEQVYRQVIHRFSSPA